MKQPFFSIVLPTKNRPELLRDVISSVLWQNFDDYELIVSDNFNDRQTYEAVAEFENDRHLKYFRTGSELNMPDHWEWATLKAIGQYTLVLTDRSVLKRGALNEIFNLIKTSGSAAVYSWRWSLFDNERNIIFGDSATYQGDPRIIKIIKSEDLARSFLESQQRFPYVLPRGLNSCYRFDVAENIRGKFGRLFMPAAPDFTSAFLFLSQVDEIYYINQSLFLSQGLEISTGGQAVLSTATSYLNTLGNVDYYAHVPIKAPIAENVTFNDFLNIQKLADGNLKDIEMDWVEYFVRCYSELLQKMGSRFTDRSTLANLRLEFENALSLFDAKIQIGVRKKTKGLIFPLLKAKLKRSFLGPLVINLKRHLEFMLKQGLKGGYSNVLTAAGFNRHNL